MLSQAQIEHYRTFGYLLMKGLFFPSEMKAISDAFDHVLASDRQGRPFSGEKRQAVLGCIEKHPVLTDLVKDDRIYEAIEQLLGKQFIWIGSDGNLYVGDTTWHPDNGNFDYDRIKVAFYLDPVRTDTGCLRVLPGSHHAEFHRMLPPALFENKLETEPRNVPFFPLESDPGDVVLFNQRVWHAAFGGKTGRRMLTMNFGENPATEKQLENVISMYQGNLHNIKIMQYSQTGEMYGRSFLNHDSPRIQAMTTKLRELNMI
ncbi:phytanoyl-CoA dioxygenase family protein [Paenibacillus montanisoli]|uniref:Phytanoyl-CoA dioxygenase n=1 Tax=Paenibacillus montanisoli TaxID=2081970 RepID=A0A328U5S3_9BACL|nr:phytanoyl-CoA dioxygenase family protein [Paenibacillus montanisoli]RAP77909.1 hypothetical protein DL346_05485 [Paenibacillus montanisoli]